MASIAIRGDKVVIKQEIDSVVEHQLRADVLQVKVTGNHEHPTPIKQEDDSMIDPQLLAISNYHKVAENQENTPVVEQQIKTKNKPAIAMKYAGLKAKKRKVSDRDESAATESLDHNVVNPLKKVKISPTGDDDSEQQAEEKTTNKGSQFAPAHKGPRAKGKSVYTNTETLMNTSKHPEWYAKVSSKDPYSRSDVQSLLYTRNLIQRCVTAHEQRDQEALDKSLAELVRKIHEIEFFPVLGAAEIKKSRIIETGGLSAIFLDENKHVFPHYLCADAQALSLRWSLGDFEASLLRGIKSTKNTKDNGKIRYLNSTLNQAYRFKKSAKVMGANALLKGSSVALMNGQWFANRACALRDGAHGELEAGVYGEKGKGAYSIVLAQGGYANNDGGEIVKYCGTQAKNSTPTYSTQLLLDAFKCGNEIRVLRGKSKSVYAPKEGIRFDGLYKIIGKELLHHETAMYRFELHRVEGQDPIRYKGVEARPTSQELEQFKAIKKLLH